MAFAALLACTAAACVTSRVTAPAAAAPSAPAEPDEAAMRAAMQEYLLGRNVGNAADRPRYLNATSIYRFQKRGCESPSSGQGVICAYLLETGTTYREARFSRHRFEFVDGTWVSRGPVRPAQDGDR